MPLLFGCFTYTKIGFNISFVLIVVRYCLTRSQKKYQGKVVSLFRFNTHLANKLKITYSRRPYLSYELLFNKILIKYINEL